MDVCSFCVCIMYNIHYIIYIVNVCGCLPVCVSSAYAHTHSVLHRYVGCKYLLSMAWSPIYVCI